MPLCYMHMYITSFGTNLLFLYRSCITDSDRLQLLLRQLSDHLYFGVSHIGHKYAVNLASSTILPSSFFTENLMEISQVCVDSSKSSSSVL